MYERFPLFFENETKKCLNVKSIEIEYLFGVTTLHVRIFVTKVNACIYIV